MTPLGPCLDCERPMRRRNEPTAPGMPQVGAHGYCSTCYQRRVCAGRMPVQRVERHAPPQTPYAEWPPREVLDGALCAETDPDAFFPDKGHNPWLAKDVCRQCPVMDACRQWAIGTRQPHGVWGGLTADERAELRRDRGAA